MKRLFLHLGFHKTATTSFQASCNANKRLLGEMGIAYPSYFFKGKQWERLNHGMLISCIFGSKNTEVFKRMLRAGFDSKEKQDALIEKLSEQLKSICNNNSLDLIISGENIANLSPSSILEMKEYFISKNYEIIPFALIRAPFEAAVSGIQETIKGGHYVPFLADNLNGATISLPQKAFPRVLCKASKIKKLIKIFEGEITFAPFAEACNHTFGPVGFLLEKNIKIEAQTINEFKQIKCNTSRSNLWVRTQNQMNKYNPLYIKEGSRIKLNNNYVKLRLLKKAENILPKFKLTEPEYLSIESLITRSETRIKDLLGEEFIACTKTFADRDYSEYESEVKNAMESLR